MDNKIIIGIVIILVLVMLSVGVWAMVTYLPAKPASDLAESTGDAELELELDQTAEPVRQFTEQPTNVSSEAGLVYSTAADNGVPETSITDTMSLSRGGMQPRDNYDVSTDRTMTLQS
jgi:flagellar basal body-associated protein FliL